MRRILATVTALALMAGLASPAAFGITGENIVHRDLAMRSQVWPAGATELRDVAVGVAPSSVGAGGQVIPGGTVLSYVTESGEVVLEREGDAASRTVVLTVTVGVHIAQVDFSKDRLVVLEGTPDPDAPGFVKHARLHAFDSATGERSLTATIGPDMEPDLESAPSFGHLDADSDGDGVAFVRLRPRPEILTSAATSTPLAFDTTLFYTPLTLFSPSEILIDKRVDGISLHRGRIAFNAEGSIGYALASRIATQYSFSWGLSQSGGFGVSGSGRAVGSPSLYNDTLAYLERPGGGRKNGSIIAVDMNSAQVSVIGEDQAVLQDVGPTLVEDHVYWVRYAGETTMAPVGGGVKTFILPHVLERTGIRANDLASSTVATLGPLPSARAIVPGRRILSSAPVMPSDLGRLFGAYTVQKDGTHRRVHSIHRGDKFPSFINARILPTVNKRGVTISVGLPPGTSLPLPLSVESTRSTVSLSGGAGKVNLSDFHLRTTIEPTTGPAGPVYTATFDEVARRTFFRFAYPGDGTFGSAESVLFEFAPTPVVTVGVSPASPVRGRPFTVSGEVRTPHDEDGMARGTAALVVQRRTPRGWDGTVKGSTKRNPIYEDKGTGGQNPLYEAKGLRITEPGLYRVRVSVPANEFHNAASSPWREFRVR